MDLQLAGKRALVTGASRGIGLAITRALVAEGAQVAMAARTGSTLRDAASGLGVPFVADTTSDESVRALVTSVVEQFGGIDILVNNAAAPASSGLSAVLADLTDDELRQEFETKVLGYVRTARAVAPHMIAQGWGRIVNISGLNARRTGTIAGSIRNVGVAAMTKNLADQLGPHGINVTVVHPGTTFTERTPGWIAERAAADGISQQEAEKALAHDVSIGRLTTAEEVADVVAFLCSPRSVAISGDAVAAGGGLRGSIHY